MRLSRSIRTRVSGTSDDGFSLAEIMVALGLVVIVMLSTAPFFYRALQRTHGQGLRQTAVSIAGQKLDGVRGLNPTTLIAGRSQALVAALIASPGLVSLANDNTTGAIGDLNYDPKATASSAAVVPTTTTEAVNKTSFILRTYIDPCYAAKSGGTCTPNTGNTVRLLRVSVDVSWGKSGTESCASARVGYCEYVATTLIDPAAIDPTFTRNVTTPTVTSMTVNPTALHPGQMGSVTMNGTGYLSGAIMASDDNSDAFASVVSNTGTSATAVVTAGVIGTRTFRIQNTDGGNAGTAPTTSFTVTQSKPTVTTLTVASLVSLTSPLLTITGTDFYVATTPSGMVQPTVVVTETDSAGLVTTLPTGAVTLTGQVLTVNPTLTAVPGATTLTATVTNYDGGTITKTLTGTVVSAPVITSVSANQLVHSATSTVTIQGTGFYTSAGGVTPVVTVTESMGPSPTIGTVSLTGSTTITVPVTLNNNTGNIVFSLKVTNPDGRVSNVFQVSGTVN